MRHIFYDSLKRFLMAFVATLAFVAPTFAANLPSGYTELEYIQSSGTQYINTGVKYTASTQTAKYDLDFQIVNFNSAGGGLWGTLGQKRSGCLWYKDSNKNNEFAMSISGTASSGSSIVIPSNKNRHHVIFEAGLTAQNNTVNINYDNTSYTGSYIYDYNMLGVGDDIVLFYGYGSATYTPTAMKVYNFKIYLDNTLVRNLVPAKNSSGVVGMYDTVNDQFYTNAGTGTFVAGPTACPGGTLDTRHESGLPVGYTLVNGLTNASSTWFDTGIKDDVDDMEYEVRVAPRTGSWYILQSRAYSGGPIYGIAGSLNGNTISVSTGNSISLASSIARYVGQTVYVRGYHRNGVGYLYVKDETANIEDTKNGTYNTNSYVPATSNIGVFGTGVDNVAASTVVYSVRLWKNGALVADYVPVKDSNNVAGFYDLVSETFKTPTRGSVTAGNEVSDPVIEQCVGGGIRIATTKYTEDAFAGLMTTLSEAITKVTNIVDTTVQQATEIGNLATTKQDRPDTDCPAGRKCLLIMGADNKPHWYLIQE